MKKIMIVMMMLTSITIMNFGNIDAIVRIEIIEKETAFIEGVRHTNMLINTEYNGETKPQKVNYLGANPTKNDELNVIVGDIYNDFGWGRGDLNSIIWSVNTRFPNYEVIGGVNGDFYNPTGYPVEAYVSNFEVLFTGVGVERTVVGFKDNGEVVFGRPCFTGYELLVFNEEGELKKNLPIDHINGLPQNEEEITVFFDNYQGTITTDLNKVVIDASKIKIDDYGVSYFGKGNLESETNNEITIELQSFVIVGTDFNEDSLITDKDYVIVQQHMGCDFEDVRFAIGAWEQLVYDGVATEVFTEGAGPQYRHPRTAVGVKEDGTVFFVTVDGRDYVNGYLGVTAYEMAEIMLYFQATEAYNLDGGGSTTMSLINEEGEYIYLNTPSDGNPRPISNGLFFVKGEHTPVPITIQFPDVRENLITPNTVYIDDEGNVVFNEVDNAVSYKVNVNGDDYITEEPSYLLDRTPGIYEIKIKAIGDKIDYRDSEYSEVITYTIYSENMEKIIQLLTKYTENEITD